MKMEIRSSRGDLSLFILLHAVLRLGFGGRSALRPLYKRGVNLRRDCGSFQSLTFFLR